MLPTKTYLTINSDKYFDNNEHLLGEAYLYYEKLNGLLIILNIIEKKVEVL